MKLFLLARNAFAFFAILFKQRVRLLQGKQIIYVIGDSHSLLFQHEIFRIFHIGPSTAFRLNANESSTNSKQKISEILEKLPQHKKNTVMFVFGEIDCRIHIYKVHKEKKISLDQAIKKTVESYLNFIDTIHIQFPKLRIMVFNIIPPGEQGNIYHYRFYPDRKTRIYISEEVNNILEKKLRKKKIPFINIYNQLIDKKGKRIKKFVFDDIHYNNSIIPFIVTELKQKRILI